MGEKGGVESKIVAGAGWDFAGIAAGKLRRYHGSSWVSKIADLESATLNFRDIFRLLRGFGQSVGVIRKFKPDVIFIKGGYVGLPVGWAARLLRVPYVIHESDVIPGLTNRLLAKGAKAIAVGFPVSSYDWPATKMHFTGSPIRHQLLHPHRLEGLAHFGFTEDLPVVLVMGGSQGAKIINDVVIETLPKLVQLYQLIHLTGEKEIERVRFETSRLRLSRPERYRPHAFLMEELGLALAASDIVVSRAGANAIAELAALQKPTILVPNPRLVGGHQTANARVLSRLGAVRVLPEAKLGSESLLNEIEHITGSQQIQAALSKSMKNFARLDADEQLADLIKMVAERE